MGQLHCPYESICSGCDYLHLSYAEQIKLKTSDLKTLLQKNSFAFPEPEFIKIAESGLRDRVDFSLEDGRLGLYSKTDKKIIDIEHCLQLSPQLQSWLQDFRKISWPFKKASFRLRVDAAGARGLWIDTANIEIKKLLDEENLLRSVMNLCFVEIGQRRKTPVWDTEQKRFRLADPLAKKWFRTWLHDQPLDLYCQVASFTQPSLKANQVINQKIQELTHALPIKKIIEFGTGIGNLSLAMLGTNRQLVACEIDQLSLEALQKTLTEHHLHEQVTIRSGDFQKKWPQDIHDFDLILCNPPRSGLKDFLNPLVELTKEQIPPYLLYMSCYPQSLCEDLTRLNALYQIRYLAIVDQFPQSKHYEVLCLLQKR